MLDYIMEIKCKHIFKNTIEYSTILNCSDMGQPTKNSKKNLYKPKITKFFCLKNKFFIATQKISKFFIFHKWTWDTQ